jgi:hypothetical protein
MLLRTELENEAESRGGREKEARDGGKRRTRESLEERHGRESRRQRSVLITTQKLQHGNNLSSTTGL